MELDSFGSTKFMSPDSDRRDTRYRVHLSVRFDTAMEFVVEYAENLSRGGIFVRGAHTLPVNSEQKMVLELPGFQEFKVLATVVHVLPPELAEKVDRKPGAGFAITKAPKGFQKALRSYLQQLGRRRDCLVFAGDEPIRHVLEAAGYRSQVIPLPVKLIRALQNPPAKVLGVVVSRPDVPEYAEAAEVVGAGNLVHGIDYLEEIELVIPELDDRL